MLPATLVTLLTFLLELCNSSPVYNMQPAFITNSVGATTGRNIRNLPCVSRKNNKHGVCMFAIDCLKANGTHLGTCIDRFYFGSCCHVEPVHDILDNTIDSDIIPQREPPLRMANTTAKPSSTTETLVSSTANLGTSSTSDISSTSITSYLTTEIVRATTPRSTTPKFSGDRPPTSSTTVNITTSVEITTTPQKIQIFQAVDGATIDPTTIKLTSPVQTSKAPYTRTTIKPTTPKPIHSKPASTRPTTINPTIRTTTKPKPVNPISTTAKPQQATKLPTPRPIPKPTTKPVRTTTTTKKPLSVTNKPSTTIKVTKKPISTVKPTKRITTTTRKPLTTIAKITRKPIVPSTTTSKTSTVGIKLTTALPIVFLNVTQKPLITISAINRPNDFPTTTKKDTVITTTSTTTTTATTPRPVLTTTVSNEVVLEQMNITQLLETVNGNPATNEIDASKPVGPPVQTKPSEKPSVVAWTVVDDKNHTATTAATDLASNITDEWIPITTPDSWVLLPSVPPSTMESLDIISATSTHSTVTTEQHSSTVSSTTTQTTSASAAASGSTTELPRPSSTVASLDSTAILENITIDYINTEEPLSITEITTSEGIWSTTEVIDRPVNMSDFTDVCGRRMYQEARIVGGEKAAFGEWPWQISLRQWRTSTYLHKCGAALLNENWAITAAHCVDNVPPSDLLLRLGEHDLSTEGEPYLHQERRVQIVALHPQFDPRTFEYDLALLRFYEPVTFQPNILPVCVPQTDESFVGRTAYVTGWGRLYEDGPLPSVLQKVSVPVINNTVCEQMYRAAGYIEHIPHIFICAGWRRGGFDSCEGDSGGPMVIQRADKRFLLAGVISWGIGCAEPNQPGVYTRISEFREWINQILQF